jgi:uncharacterized protein
MTAVDTNILIYAHRADSEWHGPARLAMEGLAAAESLWGIPWHCIHEFLGIVTRPGIYDPPTTLERALFQVNIWMDCPNFRLLSETASYWGIFETVLTEGKLKGPQVHDARIYATCLANGVRTLWSADRGFSRMRGLRVVNPCLAH